MKTMTIKLPRLAMMRLSIMSFAAALQGKSIILTDVHVTQDLPEKD